MKRYWLSSFFLFVCIVHSVAQLNESDTSAFQLRASLTGNMQQGNVEVISLRGKLDFSITGSKTLVFKSQNSSLYQAFYSQTADNDIFSRNYLYYRPFREIYPFGIAYISTNYRRQIGHRYFAGAGLTWQAIHTSPMVLKISASVVYETTRFKADTYNYEEYNGEDKINVWRSTFYLGGWSYLADRHLRLYYDAYWQPAFDSPDNFRTQIDLGADFPVWKGLAVTFLYTYTHENVVVTPIRKNDQILTFGLAYNVRSKN